MLRDSRKNPAYITVLMMVLYAVSNGIQYIGYNCIPLIISDQTFCNDSTIGYAVAAGSVSTIIGQFFWGRVSDRAKSKNRVLAVILIGMSLSGLLFLGKLFSEAYLYAIMMVFYFFFLAPQSMVDTICIENIKYTNKPFGFIRTAPPAFSTVMALLMLLFPFFTAKRMVVLLVICPLIGLIPTFLLPRTEGHDRKNNGENKKEKGSALKLLRDKRLLLLLAFGLFGCTFGNVPTTYFSVYYSTERGLGAGTNMLGAFFAIAIFLEVVTLLLGTKLVKKVNSYVILAFLLLSNAVRMFLIFLITDPYLMLVTSVFQAVWFGLMFSVATPLINSIVPPEYSATGQSLWVLTAFGISQILSNLLAGILAEYMPLRQIFLVAGIGFVALFLVLGPMLLKQAKKNAGKGV